jgi:hypothetical protein
MNRIPSTVRRVFREAFADRPHRFSRRCGGVLRLHYRPRGEYCDWELTFLADEADLIAAWVRAGASGPLPVLEYVECRWNPDYRWTVAAWRTARADQRCRRGAPASATTRGQIGG